MAQKSKKGLRAEGAATYYLTFMNYEPFLMFLPNKKFQKDKNYFLFIYALSALNTSEVQLVVINLMIRRVTNAAK